MSNALLMILKYLPYVFQAVSTVEVIAAGKKGEAKKKMVIDSITGVAGVGETVPDQEVAVISALIDSTVAAANAAGVFTHGVPAVAK